MTSFKLNHSQIQNQLNHLIKDASFPLRVQKLYSTEHFICVEARIPGKSLYLHLGRGSRYEGLFVWDEKPDSDFRTKDQFLEYLRKNLRGQKINSMELHPHDRLLRLHLGGSLDASMVFFWKGVKLVFFHVYKDQNKWVIFHSNGKKETAEYIEKKELLEKIESELEVRSESEAREAKPAASYQDYEKFYKETYLKKNIDKRKLKRQKKKIENVERDLSRLKDLMTLEKYTQPEFEAELTELKEIKKSGKKILFGSMNYYQKRGVIFDKIKNYRKNIERQEKLLEQMRESLSDENSFKISKTAKLIRVLEKSKKNEDAQKPKGEKSAQTNYKEFHLSSGEKIYLGLSANGNDYIRNKIANKSDMWVHLENYTSPHAIIRNMQENRPSIELMQTVGSIIRDHSDHQITEIPLQYTEVKNLKGLKGKPGSVIYKKEKYITVSYNSNWMHNILNSF